MRFIRPLIALVTSQAVLEKQSYMLIGRHDIDKLLRLEPASASLPNGQLDSVSSVNDAATPGVESELSELFLSLRPIRQVCVSGGCLFKFYIESFF